MKVYVLTFDWGDDNASGVEVIGAYSTREKATKAMDDCIEKGKATRPDYTTEEFVEGDYYDAYDEGWYDSSHEHYAITEQEVQ